MKNFKGLFLFVLLVLLAALAAVLSGCSDKVSQSNGQNCIECHSSKERLLADLTSNPLPKKEKSSETSGEG